MGKRILFLIVILSLSLFARRYVEADLRLRSYDASQIIGSPATMILFGGYKAPLCKFAVSNDGNYLYRDAVGSSCITTINSNGERIICNYNKSVCKRYSEILDYLYNRLSYDSYSQVAQPSFDCRYARAYVEKRMCVNPELARLDRILADRYRVVMRLTHHDRYIKRDEKSWVKRRNRVCDMAGDECIERMIRARIDYLNSIINSF